MLARRILTGFGRCLPIAALQCAEISSSTCMFRYHPLCESVHKEHCHSFLRSTTPLSNQVRGAGHSQFANRKHIKGTKDAMKAKIGMKITSNIRVAIREGGSADPKFNAQLRRLIEQAKAADVPNNTVENVIKQAEKSKDEGEILTMEARGPGNSFMVFEAFTDNVNRTRQKTSSVVRKCGGQIQQEGSVKHLFDRKGVFRVMIDEHCPDDEDDATELAIEIEAEDVRKVTEEDGVQLMEFTCDMPDFATVKKNLTEKNMNITRAKLEYIPTSTVQLEGTMLEYVETMYDRLEENCDVIRIYDNIVEKPSS